ncbi:MAG: SGNH/GDSL hydrolase family protein [Marinilabiliaceae bacterium]
MRTPTKSLATVAIGCIIAQATPADAQTTAIAPSDPSIAYIGRMITTDPDSYKLSYPGTTIVAAFDGTGVKLHCKPGSGYFMVQVDDAAPFKVAFTGAKDSLVQVATALPRGRHTLRAMYCIEGYEYRPEFRGLVLDAGGAILARPTLPERKIEFIGNSITCGYGSESTDPNEHFSFETENHYIGYAQVATRALGAQAYIVARSGIGVYRNYGGPKEGTPELNMPSQYEYTLYDDTSEKWDFGRYQPDVVCINLGTNDLSTNNYDIERYKKAFRKFIKTVRSHNAKAKIVLLCGSMMGGKELADARKALDEVAADAAKGGDKEVYRFDFTPQDGSLKYGADWHPSLWQHEKMGAELTAYLRTLMNWW